MREACPLKSRTALAAGMPLLYAYDDPNLLGDESLALRIPQVDVPAPSTIERVGDFVQRAHDDRAMGFEAWRFARVRLDADRVERRRVEFFASIVADL